MIDHHDDNDYRAKKHIHTIYFDAGGHNDSSVCFWLLHIPAAPVNQKPVPFVRFFINRYHFELFCPFIAPASLFIFFSLDSFQ